MKNAKTENILEVDNTKIENIFPSEKIFLQINVTYSFFDKSIR